MPGTTVGPVDGAYYQETETETETERCDVCNYVDGQHSSDCVECRDCGDRVDRFADRCSTCRSCFNCCSCYYCPACEDRYRHSDAMCGSCDYCNSCCECSDNGPIHDYNYSPDEITFHAVGADGRIKTKYTASRAPDAATYLGLEIETEAVHGDPESIAQIWVDSPFGYAKHDGSLSDGVECVTHPYTYQALRVNDLGATLARLAKSGARAWGTNTCGLHIHVSRRAFAHRSHMWRFVRALDSLQNELIQLAGRHSTEWAPWATDSPDYHGRYGYSDRPRATKVVAGKATNGTRYRAINMANRHTIELRFWRGSLNPIHVLGAAAVTDALVEWTRTMTFRTVRQGLTWSDFYMWAADHMTGQQFDDITALAVRRGFALGAAQDDNEEVA